MITSMPAPAYQGGKLDIEIGDVSIDEMSTVRHLQASSARRLAAGLLSESEITAFVRYLYSSDYSARLAEVVLAGRLFGARIAGELVGTAGWLAANDAGAVARLIGVFASPLYARQSLGTQLVAAAETQAVRAGFSAFTVRSPLGAVPFFESRGYQITSHGVWTLERDASLPVAFLRKVVAPKRPPGQ